MFYKPLHTIDLPDLTQLVANAVRENTRLDYKAELPGNSDEAKRKFLTDVCAFANTTGGHLIFGVREEVVDGKNTGIPEELIGIENLNANDVQLWMESLVETCIEPRITGLQFKDVVVDTTNSALVLKIPKSWNAPHVVNFRNHWRFYARNSAGNYPMDVTQVRDAFSMADELVMRLTAKREELVKAVKYKYQEAPQVPSPVLALHMLPFDAHRPDNKVEVAQMREYPDLLKLAGEKNGAFTFNFDGGRVHNGNEYIQVFHSGIIEEIITAIFVNGPKGPIVDSRFLGWDTMKSVGARLALLRILGVDGPVLVCISLLGLNQRPLVSLREYNGQLCEFKIPNLPDRNDLITDPIPVESLGNLALEGKTVMGNREIPKYWEVAAAVIRPALDSIWNAYAVEKCFEYNEESKLVGYVSAKDVTQLDPTIWLR